MCNTPDIKILQTYQYAHGVIEDIRSTTTGDVLTVSVNKFSRDTGDALSCPTFKLLVHTGVTYNRPGDVISFKADLQPVRRDDYSYTYLYSKGVEASASSPIESLKVEGQSDALRFKARNIRNRIYDYIDNTPLSQPTRNFINALLLGEKEEITSVERDDFKAAGIAHILSLSGLHVGIILMITGYLLLPLHALKLRTLRYVLMGICLCLYAYITGMSTPVMRATLMALFMLAALILQRPHTGINALSAAACIIVFLDPRALFDAGFQLSFVCALAIIVSIKVINSRFKQSRIRKLVTLLFVPVSATLVSWPITAYHFHNFATLFLPLNLIAVPLLPIYISCSIAFLLLSLTGIDFSILGTIIDKSYMLLRESAHYISSLSVHSQNIYLPPGVAITAILASFILLYTLVNPTRKTLLLTGLSYATVLILIMVSPFENQHQRIRIAPDYYSLRLSAYTDYGHTSVTLPDGCITSAVCGNDNIVYFDTEYSTYNPDSKDNSILIFGKNFKGDAGSLLQSLRPKHVVLSSRVYSNIAEEVYKSCTEFGIPIHNLRDAEFELTAQPEENI